MENRSAGPSRHCSELVTVGHVCAHFHPFSCIFTYLRAAAPAADPGRMVMWLYDTYIIYQMMGTKTRPSRTRKHHGPEGRTESKICVSRGRHVPSEISYKKLAIRFSRLAAGSLLAASLLPLRLLLRLLVSAAAY